MESKKFNTILHDIVENQENCIIVGNNKMANLDILKYLYKTARQNEKYMTKNMMLVNMMEDKKLMGDEVGTEVIEDYLNEDNKKPVFIFVDYFGVKKEDIDVEIETDDLMALGIVLLDRMSTYSSIIASMELEEVKDLEDKMDSMEFQLWNGYYIQVTEQGENEDILIKVFYYNGTHLEQIEMKG